MKTFSEIWSQRQSQKALGRTQDRDVRADDSRPSLHGSSLSLSSAASLPSSALDLEQGAIGEKMMIEDGEDHTVEGSGLLLVPSSREGWSDAIDIYSTSKATEKESPELTARRSATKSVQLILPERDREEKEKTTADEVGQTSDVESVGSTSIRDSSRSLGGNNTTRSETDGEENKSTCFVCLFPSFSPSSCFMSSFSQRIV